MAKATTIRFTEEVYARLDEASARTGLPVNSIVVAACLEWMQRHTLGSSSGEGGFATPVPVPRPRWSTLRKAVQLAVAQRTSLPMYPFERFTSTAQRLLTDAQTEAEGGGLRYIGTEHLLLAAFAQPSSHAAHALASLHVTEQAVRSTLEGMLGGSHPRSSHRIVPTSRVKKVIELAFELCAAGGDQAVGTGHVLLALAREGDGIAAHVLKDVGATAERIATALEALSDPEG